MIVHILLYGRALCGQAGTPNQWPPDHHWVFQESTEGLRPEIQCRRCFLELENKKKRMTTP